MAKCKAKTTTGKKCKNQALQGSEYCHVPSHGLNNVDQVSDDYWTRRLKDGRDPIFKNPNELWNQCVEYFEWVKRNPLKEEKVFHNNGTITRANVSKMRAMTIKGLCLWLGICEKTWSNYRKKDDFLQVITRAEDVIYSQKFEGASADLLNSNIIARDLGLKDSKELDHKSSDGSMSPKTLDDWYNPNRLVNNSENE
ncbi:MAG: DNA-packaging protein [Balneola sp.]